ncbi:MAG: NAD(P)-binding protein, partial [Candidatus Eremiobacteraeota bacterium]|nr:NAD(P)-binding protein [Candidatus Eremiobacteraeota bacterium]
MPHSRLLGVLQRSALRQRGEDALSRSDFVRGAVAASIASAALPFVASCARSSVAAQSDRVAIVGAGMAGLCAALRLHDAGIASTVYESSSRVGGRMHSERAYWNDAL